MFNKQERNSLIMLALINYANKAAISKYSSNILINFLSQFNENECQLKDFIIKNFDFIVKKYRIICSRSILIFLKTNFDPVIYEFSIPSQ